MQGTGWFAFTASFGISLPYSVKLGSVMSVPDIEADENIASTVTSILTGETGRKELLCKEDLPMSASQRVLVIGDIHGELEKLVTVFRDAGLLDEALSWRGGSSTVWFMGDFFDRGPDGIAVVDFIMRLQQEATTAGGSIHSLLGNHEVLILSAHRFAKAPAGGPGGTFYSAWKGNGGQDTDLANLTPGHMEWIMNLPAMALSRDRLLIHADSALYMDYGSSVEEVNQAITSLLRSDDISEWDLLLDEFTRR